PGNMPVLVALVRHVHEERRLGEVIANFQTEWLETEDGLKRYDLLIKNHQRQTVAIGTLSRHLRLTNQARYRADKADTLSRRAPALLEVPEQTEVDDEQSPTRPEPKRLSGGSSCFAESQKAGMLANQ